MLGSLVRNLVSLPPNIFVGNLLYPALILLAALLLLGHLTGLIGPPG